MGNKSSQAQGQPTQRQSDGTVTSPENVQVKIQKSSSSGAAAKEIPFTCSLGGGNGWPSEVTVVLYHQVMGILVVGTESGTVYAYGDGFQFMQAKLSAIDITNIIDFDIDKIIVTLADNSIAVLSLPSLTVLAQLSNWLGKPCGDITALYSSHILSQNYVFVGTSEGFVRVLEIACEDGESHAIRECDYVITSSNVGVAAKMVVSSLQICPKDEKYLAISYDSFDGTTPTSSGVTVMYDLSKKKVHRTYKSDGVTCLAWNHVGDVLYAGTRSGEVLALGLDKSSCITVWRVKSELVEADDAADYEDRVTSVRKIIWMGPQKPGDAGCLFALIGSFGSDTEHLKSVLVALTPNLLTNSVELEQIMSVPPVLGVEVVGFRVVSTLDHSQDSEASDGGVPGLLLLGQSESGDGQGSVRELLMLQCPASPVTQWSMELGLLPEPRPAMEVLPGKKAISCMKGIVPDSSTSSMSYKLLQLLQEDQEDLDASRFVRMRAQTQSAQASLSEEISKVPVKEEKKGGRRCSTRDFFSDINSAILQMESMAEQVDTWALTLATAVVDQSSCTEMDIVFVGHVDGSIIVWATSLPPAHTSSSGCGNSWIPLTAIKCGTQEITCIEVSRTNNVVAVGDRAGNVSVWEIPAAASSSSSAFKRVFSSLLDSRVTTLALSEDGGTLVAGTEDGSLYSLRDKSKSAMTKVDSLAHIGASGAIMKALIAPFWSAGAYTSATYVIYKSGHYGIVDAKSNLLLSFCSSGSNPVDLGEGQDEDEDGSHDPVVARLDGDQLVFACVMNEKLDIMTTLPDPEPKQAPSETSEEGNDEEGTSSPVQTAAAAAASRTPEQKKSGGFGFFKKGNTPPAPAGGVTPPRDRGSSASVGTGAASRPATPPAAAPRYLVYLRGRYLVTCDLHKFGLPTYSEKGASMGFSTALPRAVTMTCVSAGDGDGPFVAAQNISIVEDSARFWSQPIPCLSTIDSEGNLKLLSIPSGDVVSCCPVLPEVFSEEYSIKCSTILPNGNSYLSTSNYMIYSSTPENQAYPQVAAVPCRAAPTFAVPAPSQMLKITIGSTDAAAHIKTKTEKKDKRRGSVMAFAMSGPVDFQKLFSKSLDARRKDELFGNVINEDDDDEEDVISTAQVRSTQGKAAATKAVLDETRQAFEERGERLTRLNKKMEDFGEGAKIYKKQSAAHRERMRKKAERWGAF